MMPFLTEAWGNPSSTYRFGSRVSSALDLARSQVANLIGADLSEIIFTSCATEANNAAIHSALLADPTRRHVVTSQVEHSSVLHYCEELVRRGYEVTFLPVDQLGHVNLEHLEHAIRADTAIVSLMWANNETGVIAPVSQIGEICARRGIHFHCDAVQAAGKLSIDFPELPVQSLSLSGHKIGAPKGIGALVFREGAAYHPLIYGGKQEKGRRGGTENVANIVALGAACAIASQAGPKAWEEVAKIRNEAESMLLNGIAEAYRNGDPKSRLPNTFNIGFRGIDSDTLVTFCDRHDICVSSGSACLESALAPSHVVLAMTQSHERASEALRVSLGLKTPRHDLVRFVATVIDFAALSH